MEYSRILSNIYYDISSPAGFSTAKKLYDEAKLLNSRIRLKDVKDWLSGENTYTLHKPIRKNFKRNPIIASRPNEDWQADLVDLQEYSRSNSGYKYLLTIIDVFSKYAFVAPLKSKGAVEVKNNFAKIFKQRIPSKLQTDKGTEFVNTSLKNYLKDLNVTFFQTKNDEIKCSIVERFNRTLKSKMFKYFTATGKRRWVDKIQNIVNAYNRTKHRTIGMKPIDVTLEQSPVIFKRIYGYPSLRALLKGTYAKPKLKVGDKVRIKYITNVFEKGYYPNWTDQLFAIVSMNKRKNRVVYTLKDEHDKILNKKFYTEELQKVKENLFRVEKVIKRRTRNKRKEVYVKWLNYPTSFNSWILETDLQRL